MNSRPLRLLNRRRASDDGLRPHAHQFSQPNYFAGFDSNATLPAGTSLQEIDRDALLADFQFADAAPTEPIVERRHGDAESTGGFGGSEKFVGHGRRPLELFVGRLTRPPVSLGNSGESPACDQTPVRCAKRRRTSW